MRAIALPLLLLAFSVVANDPAADGRSALLEQRREKLKQKWEDQFRAADTDSSRSLTPEEVRAGGLPDSLANRFAEIDADRDGSLTPEELWAVYEKRLAEQRRIAGPPR